MNHDSGYNIPLKKYWIEEEKEIVKQARREKEDIERTLREAIRRIELLNERRKK